MLFEPQMNFCCIYSIPVKIFINGANWLGRAIYWTVLYAHAPPPMPTSHSGTLSSYIFGDGGDHGAAVVADLSPPELLCLVGERRGIVAEVEHELETLEECRGLRLERAERSTRTGIRKAVFESGQRWASG